MKSINDLSSNDLSMKHVVIAIISKLRPNGDRVYLLVKSTRDFGVYTGCWYPPGGHVEQDEDQKAALIREVREELGMEIRIIEKIAETDGDVEDQRTHWWRCEVVSDSMMIDHTEIADAGWFTLKEMNDLNVWPATSHFFQSTTNP